MVVLSGLVELSSFVGNSYDVDKKIAQAAMSSRWIAILCGEVVFSSVAMLNSAGTRPKATRAEPRMQRSLTVRKDKTEARGGHTESPPRHHPAPTDIRHRREGKATGPYCGVPVSHETQHITTAPPSTLKPCDVVAEGVDGLVEGHALALSEGCHAKESPPSLACSHAKNDESEYREGAGE